MNSKLILDYSFFKSSNYKNAFLLLKDNLVKNILTENDIVKYLCNRLLIFPSIRLAKNGKYLQEELYTKIIDYKEFKYLNVIDTEKIFAYYNDGTSIIISNAHECFYNLKEICFEIEQILGKKVTANIYITPPYQKGFGLHFDKHDVFAVQLKGRKRWHLFEYNTQENIRLSNDFLEKGKIIDVNIGEVLYVPEGLYHDVECLENHSIHLTIGINKKESTKIKKINWSLVNNVEENNNYII